VRPSGQLLYSEHPSLTARLATANDFGRAAADGWPDFSLLPADEWSCLDSGLQHSMSKTSVSENFSDIQGFVFLRPENQQDAPKLTEDELQQLLALSPDPIRSSHPLTSKLFR
jgi:hypothetical protein